jgi:hypothetical protein
MSLQTAVRAAIAELPPGEYKTDKLAGLSGAISWGAPWSTVKKILEKTPNITWNQKHGRATCAWVKTEPIPEIKKEDLAPPSPEYHSDCVEGKGHVTSSLNRIEMMLQKMLASWDIPTPTIPEPSENAKKSLAIIGLVMNKAVVRKGHYIQKGELAIILKAIKQGLS